MSETQKHNPEASTQKVIELYQIAANYLETSIAAGTAKVEPAHYTQFAMLKVSTPVAELNGRKIALEYERPAREDDPTKIDTKIPLAWTDDEGRNHWQTPIRITVRDTQDSLLNDYYVEYAGNDEWTRVTDEKDDSEGIAWADASAITAHLDWGLANLPARD